MGRPKGRRSPEYEQKRRELAQRIFDCMVVDGNTSLNAMAERTGVSRPTLRHYFGDRDGAVRAALDIAAANGRPHVQALVSLPVDDAEACLGEGLRRVIIGWRDFRVGNLHHVGLKVGLEDDATGKTYVSQILEPLLGGFERLLERLIDAGRLVPLDPRTGALTLVSPVVVALLHQHGLGGNEIRPLDIEALAAELVHQFCRAHAPG
ncbi:MAG: TetR/AcrR family transcriptional regulator [Myxococcales bacterium]|nr:TetR/AcrR family transcriptional regulator [Myxococcales bacterium]